MDLFEPGRNCLGVYTDIDVRVLIDGADYFDELAHAMEQAQETIYIAGWEIESQMWLRPHLEGEERLSLGPFLRGLVSRKPHLRIYLLIWDMSEVKRFASNPWAALKPLWVPHHRLKLRYDDHYPFGGCHHQKFVVIDDQLAYCGGMDLTVGRWDRPEHLPLDPRRNDVFGVRHGPIHDAQVRFMGEPARVLGEQFRKRWLRVSRRAPHTPRTPHPFTLPKTGMVRGTKLALSRTDPIVKPAIREVEQLFLDSIRIARHLIYIENQYLTSVPIGDVLAERLQETDGPEVVIIGPRSPAGWLEEVTVGLLRWRVVENLEKCDVHNRLRILYPMASVKDDIPTYVHGKVMIIDDCLLRIGSANVSQRSCRIDTELDVTLLTSDSETIRQLRNSLLAEHLGVEDAEIDAHPLNKIGTLHAMLDDYSERDSDRRLLPLEEPPDIAMRNFAHDGDVLMDPDEPRGLIEIAEVFLGHQSRYKILKRIPRGVTAVVTWTALVTASVGVLWFFDIKAEFLLHHLSGIHVSLVLLALLFTLGFGASLYLTIIVVMLLAPLWQVPLLLPGFVAVGALLSYAVGMVVGRGPTNRIFGLQVQDVRRVLFRRGIFSVITLRLLPVSSFAAVGFAAGAARQPLRPYMVGTLVGVIPNVMLLGMVAFFVTRFVFNPNPFSFLIVLVVLTGFGLVMRAISRGIDLKKRTKS